MRIIRIYGIHGEALAKCNYRLCRNGARFVLDEVGRVVLGDSNWAGGA